MSRGIPHAGRTDRQRSASKPSHGTDGLHAPKAAQTELRGDGNATVWEDLLRQQEHVVGLFPKRLRSSLSWREDVFESSDDRIALLDDDAIVGAYRWSAAGTIQARGK